MAKAKAKVKRKEKRTRQTGEKKEEKRVYIPQRDNEIATRQDYHSETPQRAIRTLVTW